MEKEYKGLKENLERFKNDFSDEKTRLLFSIGYKQGYDQALTLTDVVLQSEQLPKNNCTLNRQTCGKGSGCEYPHCHI